MRDDGRPWTPRALRQHDDFGDFFYVVVEEVIDDRVGLIASDWPGDDDGAPQFQADAREAELTMSKSALQTYLDEVRYPGPEETVARLSSTAEAELRERPITVGDAFATRLSPEIIEGSATDEVLDPAELGEVIDITAEARESAKAAMYRALTPALDPAVVKEVVDAADEQELEYGGPA